MKTLTYKYRTSKYNSKIFEMYFGGLTPCVFDIETTGLSHSTSEIILTALLIPINDGVEIKQFFAENPDEEADLLIASINYLNARDINYLVTFNGDRFDIPFFNSRLKANGINTLLNLYNFDLFKFVKHYSSIGNIISSLTQKNLEYYMGIGNSRKDSIDGRESVKLYLDYLKTGNIVNKQLILRHNLEDVMQLFKLLKVNNYVDLHAALYRYGFPFIPLAAKVKPKIKKNSLVITGSNLNYPNDIIVFPDSSSSLYVSINHRQDELSVELPLFVRGESLYFDLTKLNFDRSLYDKLSIEKFDGFVSDYLILVVNGQKKYREINALSILVLDYICKEYS